MVVFWQSKHELKRVFFGKKVTLECGHCHKKASFYECNIDDSFSIYFVDLWKKTKRVMQCGECLAVVDYFEIYPQEKVQAEQDQAEQQRQAEQAEAQKKAAEEEERRKQQERENQERADRFKKMEAQVDDELSELKRKMGKE